MATLPPPVGDSASAQVEAFIDDLQEHMRALVMDHDEWLSEELRKPFRDAFEDLESTFAATREWLQTKPEAALAEAGLADPQLPVKTGGFLRALGQYFEAPSRWASTRVLKWGNILLGSLSKAFPPAGIIKELKEALEVELEAREEEDRKAGEGS